MKKTILDRAGRQPMGTGDAENIKKYFAGNRISMYNN